MPFSAYGAPQFGLNDVKIATWLATNSYGTAVDVMSAQQLGGTLRVVSAELTGDDTITAQASRVIGGQIQMRFGSVNLAALEVLLGNTATSSVASPNAVKQLKLIGSDNMPYFGLVGKALAEEGIGDFLIWYPKCKIMSDVQLVNLEYGQFAVPELTIMAVHDDTFGVLSLIERQTAAAIAIPPANIV
jgi:hypothetical protein